MNTLIGANNTWVLFAVIGAPASIVLIIREAPLLAGYKEIDIVPTEFNGIPGIDLVLMEKKI